MKGVIIAAGRGDRLHSLGDSKPLIALHAKPLIQHVVERAMLAGLGEIIVVVGYQAQAIETLLGDLAHRQGFALRSVHNADWKRGNGTSVLAAARQLDEPFILMMADHIMDPAIIRNLASTLPGRDEILLAVDRRLDNPMVDPLDVTRVETRRDRIISIGKQLAQFDAYDTGVFLCSPSFRLTLEAAAQPHADFGLSAAVQAAADKGCARAVDIGDRFWIDVDNEEMLQRASQAVHG